MDPKIEKRRDFLVNAAYFSVIAVIIFLLYRYAIRLILPFLIALILVAILAPLARKLNSIFKIRTEVFSFVLMLTIYIVIGLLLFFLVIQIMDWAQSFYVFFEQYYESTIKPGFNVLWDWVEGLILQLPDTIAQPLDDFQNSLAEGLDDVIKSVIRGGLNKVGSVTVSVPNFFVAFLFTILLSFFISLQYEKVKTFLKNQLPPKGQQIFTDLRDIVFVSIGQYVRALIILMFITFIELSIGLLILRVPHAILIAAGVAILDALPVFGTGTVLIPWAFISLLQSDYRLALGLTIIYGVITLVRNVLEPKVVGDKLGLNPIVSLVSIYLGFKLMGVFGMILMPILTQSLIELHKKGTITLFRDPARDKALVTVGAPPDLAEESEDSPEQQQEHSEEPPSDTEDKDTQEK